jgi:hypothetical protein
MRFSFKLYVWFCCADDLIAEYNLVRPAEVHNVLVRIGVKDRGLSYHWTEDLMKRLQSLKLETYQLHWGVGTIFSSVSQIREVGVFP